MKYLVITRSLQSDYDWEKDAENIATIFLELLKLKFPKGNGYYKKAFITFFSRYIADSKVKPTDSKGFVRQKLADLLEEIELTGYEETKMVHKGEEIKYFKFNYTQKDYDLLIHLLDTTTREYYLNAKEDLIDKVEFLKQDYGKDLYLVNSTIFYTHLLNTFYEHGCKVLHSHHNNHDEMLEELIENKEIDEDYQLILE